RRLLFRSQSSVSALNLRRGLRLLSRYSPTITTQLQTPVPNLTSMHSPSLSQREPPAVVTFKSDFPPPRQPNENNKSLTLQISACVSPNLQSPCKLGETHAEICKVKLLLFSLGCRGGGKSLLKVTTAGGSRWERDGLCILVKLGTGVCNWVVIVGEYLLSERKPLRRLRALTAVCCFGRVCKSLLFFMGVSDALELVSSSIA